MGIVAVIGLASLLSSTAFAAQYLQGKLIGYNESKLTVFEEQTDRPFAIDLTELAVRDSEGNIIHETTAGSQGTLQAGIASYRSVGSEPVYAIFEVRDPDDITDYLTLQNTTINSAEQMTVTSSWVAPDRPGEYTIRAFAIACIQCPAALARVLTYELTVIPASPDEK